VAAMSVHMEGLRPMVSGEINGAPVRFIVDTGAGYSILPKASADALHLPIYPAPDWLTFEGVGGGFKPELARVAKLRIDGAQTSNVEFVVGGTDVSGDAAGLLGQNFWQIRDLELDFSHGALRFVQPKGCGERPLAYWAKPGDALLEMDLTDRERRGQGAVVYVGVNGVKLRAVLDTGAERTVISYAAARRAGIDPNGPLAGTKGAEFGFGSHFAASRLVQVDSVDIGGEKILHTHLIAVDHLIAGEDEDMLLGEDFFLSHRVYIARSQGKVYATYEGGPVFSLAPPSPQAAPATPTPASTVEAGEPSRAAAPTAGSSEAKREARTQAGPPPGPDPAQARLASDAGAAAYARQEAAVAITDFTRAHDLDPTNALYLYERAQAYAQTGELHKALADLDAAITLAPKDAETRLMRAALRLRLEDREGARSDLDAAAPLLAATGRSQLALADLYEQADEPKRAAPIDRAWLREHPDDALRPVALAELCWVDALGAEDPGLGRRTCDAAVHDLPKNPSLLDSRGWLRLKTGDAAGALRDFEAALAIKPKLASSLYGRSLLERRGGAIAQADIDLAAANKEAPKLVARYKSLGLSD
ncbi:MAG: aspartyl protease family protein, partial [Alphaproteobacteria bacterium]|nr:aspartyl protease family protein [Alphaproteobacteria bacterium]